MATDQADVQTERAVLGGALFDRESIPPIRALTPEHFHDGRNRVVFEHLARLDAARRPLDLLTLERSLRDGGDYDAAGGAPMLGWLAEAGALTIPAYMPDYCATLDRLYRKRTGRAMALTLADHLGNGHDPEATLTDARALVEVLTPAAVLELEVVRLGDDYRVTYPGPGVVLALNNVHDGREGLRAEVSATVHGRALKPWDRKLRFEAHLAVSDPATTLTSRTLTLRLKFGTVTIATGTLQTSDSDGASVNAIGSSVGYVLTALLTADGATASQIGHIAISGPVAYSSLTGKVLGAFSTATTGRGTGSVDSTAEKAFAITVQWSEALSGRTVTIEAATLAGVKPPPIGAHSAVAAQASRGH